jgi:hypothetical protein
MGRPTDVSEGPAAFLFRAEKWLKMEAVGSSEMMVPIYRTPQNTVILIQQREPQISLKHFCFNTVPEPLRPRTLYQTLKIKLY